MNQTQKIIKYFAIALAIFLIISIFSILILGITRVTSVFYPEITNNMDINKEEYREITIEKNISNLEIDLSNTNLIIKNSSIFKIETNNQYVNIKQNIKHIHINETKHRYHVKDYSYDLIIYIPDNYIFNYVNIDAGAGRIDIESLNSNKVSFSLGAGKATINNLNITDEMELESGVGEIIINSSNLNDLELDIGVGNFELNAILTGKNEINSGIGKVTINLLNSINNYNIITDSGIGSVKVNNNKINNSSSYGTGPNLIKIDNGIGEIEITTLEN